MINPEEAERLYDILFELSNDIRHNILLLISEKKIRMTNIAQTLDLTPPEVSRHLSRLSEAKLIEKDVSGFYWLTDYGQHCLHLLDNFYFFTRNRDYFTSHNSQGLPGEYKNRLPELAGYKRIDNFMEFLNFINERIKNAEEFVWLYIDQYPILAIETILESVKNGVNYKIIEHEDLSGPSIAFDKSNLIYKGEKAPEVEIKINNFSGVYLFVSDSGSAVAFPTDSGFDYSGFIKKGDEGLQWSLDLFEYYWDNSRNKSEIPLTQHKIVMKSKGKIITIEANEDPVVNYHAIQDAVNSHDEVILKGKFNIGTSCIKLAKNVIIRGEKRENNTPLTSIYKKGWMFPFRDFDSIFKIDGKDAQITIENISFTDFNHTCIWAEEFNKLIIRKNKLSLISNAGRGLSTGTQGDILVGIWIRGKNESINNDEIIIEDNQVDFAVAGVKDGMLPTGFSSSISKSDFQNHESIMSFGIYVERISCKIRILENNIRNANAKGISITGFSPEKDIVVEKNCIYSSISGSYPFGLLEAGVGIHIINSQKDQVPSFSIHSNNILFEKPDYCGIISTGFNIHNNNLSEESCYITNNRIKLIDGQAGIKIDSENIEVSKNVFIGNAFFGIVKSRDEIIEPFSDNLSDRLKEENEYGDFKLEDRTFWIRRRRFK